MPPLRGRTAAAPRRRRARRARERARACTPTSSPARSASPGRGPRRCARPGSTTCRSASRPTRPCSPTASPASPRSTRRSRPPALVKELGWPLTLNVVLHRQNIDRIEAILGWVERARRRPRRAGQHPVLRLGPAQPGRAAAEPRAARARRDRHARGPRADARADRRHLRHPRLLQPVPQAVHGRLGRPPARRRARGRRVAVPRRRTSCRCRGASVREHDLAWIWESSPLFSAFRGTDWMPDPCASCERREVDLGGCRCQAFQLTGDAAPHRPRVRALARPPPHRRGGGRRERPRRPRLARPGPGAGARADAGAGVPAPPRRLSLRPALTCGYVELHRVTAHRQPVAHGRVPDHHRRAITRS